MITPIDSGRHLARRITDRIGSGIKDLWRWIEKFDEI
jgi:hypothetical protein